MRSSGLVSEIPKIPSTSAESCKQDGNTEPKHSKPSEEFFNNSDSDSLSDTNDMPAQFQATETSHGTLFSSSCLLWVCLF